MNGKPVPDKEQQPSLVERPSNPPQDVCGMLETEYLTIPSPLSAPVNNLSTPENLKGTRTTVSSVEKEKVRYCQ